jgi:drug/metabolite transporter (DMT)-like permease
VEKESVLPYLWMLGGCLSFAGMGTLAHAVGSRCDWRWLLLTRTALPLVLVAALAFASGVRLVFWRPPVLWMRSIAGSISVLCTFFVLTHTDLAVSDVFTLTHMFPVWVAVLSWPLLGAPPPGSVWAAVASGVAGVALIEQPHLAEENFASLIALAASFSTALAMIGLHRLKGIDPRAIVVHFSAVALVMSLALFALFERNAPTAVPEGDVLLRLLGVGVLATVGQLLLTKAFASGHPARVSVVGLSQVLFALLFDVLLLDHTVNAWTLLGIALVVAPTAWLMTNPVGRREPVEELPPGAEG